MHPKFPGQPGPLALLCNLSVLPVLLLDWGLLGHTTFRCSHQPFWSDEVMSPVGGWSYVSAPSPGQEGEGLLQATHMAQENPMPRTGFSLGWSALPARLLVLAWLGYTVQVFLSASLVRWSWETLFTVSGAMTQLLAWAWANQALGLANFLIWGFQSSRSVPGLLPYSKSTIDLVLQMSKASGWGYYLDTVGMDLVWQDSRTGCCKLLPAFPTQSDSLADSPAIPMGWDQSSGSPIMGSAGCSSWVLFSHWRNQRVRGKLSAWCCTGLREGKCGQYVDAVYFDLCSAGGRFTLPLPLCSRILSVVSCSWRTGSFSSCEEEWSQEWPMLPTWWRHFLLLS